MGNWSLGPTPVATVVHNGRIDTGAVNPSPTDEATSPPLPPIGLPWPPLVMERVALRPWGNAPTDAARLVEAWADPDVARWTAVPAENDLAAAQRWIAGEQARRDSGLAVDLVVTEAGVPDVVLGEVGLVVVEPEQRWAEIGFWLFPTSRGEGRATSAVGLVTSWAKVNLGMTRVFAQVHPDNPAAGAVVERVGFQHAGELPNGRHVWVHDG